jgi:hypothetical protein
MSGVGEGAVLGQRTRLPSHLVTAKGDDHAVEVDADLDASADRPGVDRVVATIDATLGMPPNSTRQARWPHKMSCACRDGIMRPTIHRE